MKEIENNKVYYSWEDYNKDMRSIDWLKFDHVVAIYRGSLGMGAHISNVKEFVKIARKKPSAYPLVFGYCLFGKVNAKNIVYSQEHDGSWIVFPWETLDESI